MKKLASLFFITTALYANHAIAQEKTKLTPAPKSKTTAVKKTSTTTTPVEKKEVAEKKEGKGCCKMSNCKKRMGELVALSDDQKAMMKKIKEDTKEKIQALNKNQTITLKEYNDKKTLILREAREKRKSILTTEQKDKISALKNEKESSRVKEFEKRLNKLKLNLNLKDDQVAQIKGMYIKQRDQIESIKKNNQLNDQEKKNRMRELKIQTKEIRIKILTEEQRIKLEQMRGRNTKKEEFKINEVKPTGEQPVNLN